MFGGTVIKLDDNKNQAYRLYFTLLSIDNASIIPRTGVTNFSVKKLSKDNGSFNTTTNSPVEMGYGWYYIDLTADEMNADSVKLVFGGVWGFTTFTYVEILTNSLSLNSVVPDISTLTTEQPTMSEVLGVIWWAIRKSGGKSKWSLAKWMDQWSL